MDKKIAELTKPEYKFELMLSEDGSGRGAALVAAVAVRQQEELRRRQRTKKISTTVNTMIEAEKAVPVVN